MRYHTDNERTEQFNHQHAEAAARARGVTVDELRRRVETARTRRPSAPRATSGHPDNEIMKLAKMIDAPGETLAQDLARDAIARGLALEEFRRRVAAARREVKIRALGRRLNAEHLVYAGIRDNLTPAQFFDRVQAAKNQSAS